LKSEKPLFGDEIKSFFPAYDLSGRYLGEISEVRVGEEVIILTQGVDHNLFELNSSCNWDFGEHTRTKNVVSFESMFNSCQTFNGVFGGQWDLSNATYLYRMFANCNAFDQNINGWNVSNVRNMYEMFANCTSFNKPLGNWNTKSVTDMRGLFANATVFNQDISQWCVPNIHWRPMNFCVYSALDSSPAFQPKWGTCPRGEDKP
jgi:surface protein